MATATVVTIQVAPDEKTKEWTIAPANRTENDQRLKNVNDKFTKLWDQRCGKTRDHKPIVFYEGEVLRFECDHEFAIGAKKNPDADEVPGTPDSPFGWTDARVATKEENGKRILDGQVPKDKRIKEQAFYKFFGWVIVNGQKIDVDPDGYCGG